MVAMRDGAKLFTLVLTPKNAKGPLPILLQRTPYDASRKLGSRATSPKCLRMTMVPKATGLTA